MGATRTSLGNHGPKARNHHAFVRGAARSAAPVVDHFGVVAAADHPRLAAEENLPDLIDRIETTFARKGLVTADFYRRTNQPLGAAYTYRYVSSTYPETPEATEANAAFSALPEKARTAALGKDAWHAPLAPPTTEGAQ